MLRTRVLCVGVAVFLCSPIALAQATVSPSGGNDTAALQAAFDSCVPGGPRCTITLSAGTFRTTQILATNFHGAVTGAGMGRTIVEPFGQLHVSKDTGPAGVYSNPPATDNPYPHLILLLASELSMSDLSFRVGGAEPTDGWYYGCGTPDCYVTWLKTMVSVDGIGHFDRVEFSGEAGTDPTTWTGTNVNNGPDTNGSGWGTATSELVVRNCLFANLDNGFEASRPVAKVLIGGSPQAGNVFDGSPAGVVIFTANASLEESYNTITGAGPLILDSDGDSIVFARNRVKVTVPGLSGIDVENYRNVPFPATSTVAVEHNTIEVAAPGGSATNLDDRWLMSSKKSLDVLVADNSVTVSDPSGDIGMTGIWLRYVADGLVANNRVAGTGCQALHLGRTASTIAQANNVGGFVANDPWCGVPAVPIHLDIWAHDNVVIGGGETLADSVLDWGTNDTLTGVNSAGTPPGPALSDMRQRARAIR